MKTEGLKQKCLNCLQLEDNEYELNVLQQSFEEEEEFLLGNLQQIFEEEESLKDLQKTSNNINVHVDNWLKRVQIHQSNYKEFVNGISLFLNKEIDDLLNDHEIVIHNLEEENHADPMSVIKKNYLMDNNIEENYYSEENSEEDIEEILRLYNYKYEEEDLFNKNHEEDFYKETFEDDLTSENINSEENLDQDYLIPLIKLDKGKEEYGQLIIRPIISEDQIIITMYREFNFEHEVVIAYQSCELDNNIKNIRSLIFKVLQELLDFENYFPSIVEELLTNDFKLEMQYKYQRQFWKNWNKMIKFYSQQEIYIVQYSRKIVSKLNEEIVYLSINL